MKVEADRVGPTLAGALVERPGGGTAAARSDHARRRNRRRPAAIQADRRRDRPGSQPRGTANLDLRSFAFDSEWRMERKRANDKIDQKAALPAAIIQYRGPVTALSALEARINTDALERELTARKMEFDLEELERLRQADEARRRSELERQRRATAGPWAPTRPATPNTPVLPKGTRRPRPAEAQALGYLGYRARWPGPCSGPESKPGPRSTGRSHRATVDACDQLARPTRLPRRRLPSARPRTGPRARWTCGARRW